ncbi:uncharacterized protein B0H64DRAFT_441077 [Chaetomium fimeti]|uniref:Cytidyltransferase-like domain-containing protein n=1 Tax=Chaetomium fimeti TaxID=1854472 RepID=A0AAE0HJG1_9PEZI|nr:hypothetical protein B0H64DRAFT_441077 [Chaetomium fimeti]
MTATTADLGAYISRIHNHGGGDDDTTTTIFGTSPAHRRPQLRRHRPNRVLLYPGCFNPPHVAHSALLRRAFESTPDLGVVAAVVLPLDDDRLEEKRQDRRARKQQQQQQRERVRARRAKVKKASGGEVGEAGETGEGEGEGADEAEMDGLLLTREQRVALWRGWGGWCEEEWHEFRERLVDAVRRDGFELEFVCLVGADYVGRRGVPWGSWDCEKLVVGDAGRAVDFVATDGDGRSRLLSLAWCEKWEPVEEDEEAAHQRVMDDIAWLVGVSSFYDCGYIRRQLDRDPRFYENLAQDGLRTFTESTRKQWMCRRKRSQGQWLRYVPCPDDERTIHTGGSTKIRDSIASCPTGQLLKKLEGTVLNAEMLVEFVMDARSPEMHHTYRIFGLP